MRAGLACFDPSFPGSPAVGNILMPLLVDVHPPPDAPREHVEHLIESCSSAAPVRCALWAGDQAASRDATVEWQDDDYDEVRIWVTTGQGKAYRSLAFGPTDALEDRIQAAGLMLGALVREGSEEPSPAAAQPNDEQPVQAREEAPVPGPDPSDRLSASKPFEASLQASVGSGLGGRGGLRATAGWFFSRPVGVYAHGNLVSAFSSIQGATFASVSLGAGAVVRFSPESRLQPALGIGFAWQETRVSVLRASEEAQGAVGQAGAEFWLGGTYWFLDSWGIFASSRLDAYPETPSVFVQGTEIAELPALAGAGHLGVVVRF